MNLQDFKNLGYHFENADNINRVIRVVNNQGQHIYSYFMESGYGCCTHGNIFNYMSELHTAIKQVGALRFFNDILI